MMELFRAARLIKEPEDVSEDVESLLEDHAFLFLKGGGRTNLQEWANLSDVERRAFVKASERLLAEAAFAMGLAQQGKLGAAHVYAAVDGGRLLAQTHLEFELDRMIGKLHG